MQDGGGIKLIRNVDFFHAGYCTHPERMVVKGGKLKNAKFPAIFTLIRHSRFGNILFDTGYSERFYAETVDFPFNIYARLTPVYLKSGESAQKVLHDRGIEARSINYIIISHFHADHIGGLKDFQGAKFIYSSSGFDFLKEKKGFAALKNAFLAGLIPEEFENRSIDLTETMKIDISTQIAPFADGYDLFGDKSIILIELSGHAAGQIGALITDKDNNKYFLIADAAWRHEAYKELKLPSRLADLIIYDKRKYVETLTKIHQLYRNNPQIKIVPSHCIETLEGVEKWTT